MTEVAQKESCRKQRHDPDGTRSCVLYHKHRGKCLFRVLSDQELALSREARSIPAPKIDEETGRPKKIKRKSRKQRGLV